MPLSLILAAADLRKTEKFYREILLLSPEFIQHNHAGNRNLILFIGNLKIRFQSLPELESQHPAFLQNITRDPLGVGVRLEIDCTNLEEINRSIHYYHWPIIYELDDQEHQRKELWLQDPDGYLLVLTEQD